MNAEVFKRLIKESVREVLREEGLLNENKFSNANPTKFAMLEQFKTTPYHVGPKITSTGDPLQDLLRQTAMESNDLSNFGTQ